MGLALPQVVTSDRASGAQVIDGSLKFDGATTPQYLKRTLGAGNTKTYTMAYWFKYDSTTNGRRYVSTGYDSNSRSYGFYIGDNSNLITFNDTGTDAANYNVRPSAVLRDNGWYHLVFNVDTTQSDDDDKVRIYINGVKQTSFGTNTRPSLNATGNMNTSGRELSIGAWNYSNTYASGLEGQIAQFYHIDGQALDASYFGYTDGLTNTWRPKKYTGSFNAPAGASNGSSVVPTSTSNVAPSGSYGNGIATAALLFGGTELVNGQNHIRQDGGGIEWSPAIPLTGSDVAGAKCLYFNNQSTSFNIEFKINGSWVTAQANAQAVIGTGSALITLATTGNWTGVRVTGGSNISVTTVAGIFVNGNLVYAGTAAGVNGFYLPMDGSAPIGKDQSGNGNDYTPVNFGGSLELDNPNVSGARPILNTGTGGTVARPGVFGSEENLFYKVTTANGSVYQFDITSGNNPSLSFIRGATYRFDYTSHSSHPLRFSSTNPDSSTSAYTDGTNTSVSNVITITVPHNAPNTLYYYCTAHASAMNGSISVTTDETKADLYAWKNTLALPLVGSKDDVSNSVNSGSTTKVITATNSVASSAVSNFYGGSWYFDGSGDTLTVPNNTDFNFGSGDSTIEMWIYPTRISGTQENIMTRGTSGYSGFIMSVKNFLDTVNGSSWGVNITYDNPLIANAWQHIAVCRSGNTWTVYINGIANGSATASGSVQASAQTLTIGQRTGQTDFQGYMSDIHIYKGAAKYTSNFIVPATSPDILPDTPSGVSGGSKLTKVTDGAVNFSASGDKLTVSNSSGDFDFGSGDFTIESYLYMTAQSGGDAIINLYNYSSNRRAWNLYHNSNDGNIELLLSTDGSSQISRFESNTPLPKNRWVHVVVTKASNVYRMFFDGVQVSTTTVSETIFGTGTTADSVGIGDYAHTNAEPYSGFISNIRILKGTALYTTNFIPPTRTLTNVTNTKLLCCQSNTSANSATVTPGTFSNSGVVYSSGIAGSQDTSSGGGAVAAFDGKLGTSDSDGSYPAAGQTLTWTPANSALGTTLPYSSTIRVYVKVDANGDDGGLIVIGANGSQTVDAGGSGGKYVDISAASSPITSIAWSRASSGGQGVGLQAVEVDGTTLIDGLVGKTVMRSGNAAANNFNPFTTDINAVRGQETGYATWNPLNKASTPGLTLSDGNLSYTNSSTSANNTQIGTLSLNNGKFYFENLLTAAADVPGSTSVRFGISKNSSDSASNIIIYNATGNFETLNTTDSAPPSYTTGNVIGVAVDCVNGSIEYFKDGASVGTKTFTVGTDDWNPFIRIYKGGSNAINGTINFGQKPFKYAPPAGFQPLNAANVRPETVITRPDHYVKTVLWTGNDVARSILTGNAPDFVWIKDRSITKDPVICDSVRGAGETLRPDDPGANVTAIQRVSSFNSNGFSVGTDSGVNNNNDNFVGWTWKAGGNKNTFNVDDVGYASAAAAGLDGGTINPTGASVGTKQGFSILKYQGNGTAGANISHGLLEAPKLMIHKSLDQSRNWYTITTALDGSADYLYLNTQGAVQNSSVTVPTSSLMYFTSSVESNNNSENYVAYLWHDVPGLQKFGSFEANQNADGPFVELGFRPAIVWIKNIDNYDPPYDWVIYDNARSTFNPNDKFLCANLNNAENSGSGGTETTRYVDFLSNGFKVRTASTAINLNAHTQLYCAWAEAPVSNLYGGQSNAR